MLYDIDKIIADVEKRYILPSLGKRPQLDVIMSCSPLPGEISYLKQIYKMADKYDVALRELRTCDPLHIAGDLRGYPCDGAIRISDFGKDSNEYVDDRIGCEQDLDGSCIVNRSLWTDEESYLRAFPCTSLAAYLVLDEYFSHYLDGTDVAVINRSNTVGKPLALLLNSKRANATVHMLHSKSIINSSVISEFDAVVTAVGKPGWFTFDSMMGTALYKGLVIDVGVAQDGDSVHGDVADRVADLDYINVVKSIGPKGIGKLTTTILFAKLFGGFKCVTWH